ncbi:gliding motility protein GldC [Faecalibacter rhinopitheci]|uniref:Gliding motility protein GldC n=1 Tax=Faecalibacter rhinopitheci TaxID=2779678 RepID=A0A8J7FNG9_9FLAO|nr:gliding motility protein GldC [Faecalibacter rhinopitheci]MBF0597045.1 gliding motility protein GldC [Faecalibacter rhinopitheci]MBQ0147692.1 gliding motility protein GldC [Candidatus Onthonaster equi]
MRKTNIAIEIELDENHVPEKMNWNAPDGGVNNEETKAMLLSVWDDKAKEALRIDLWTKDMTQDDMKRFFHQIFISMSSSYQRATDEEEVAQKIAAFAEEFAYAAKIKG